MFRINHFLGGNLVYHYQKKPVKAPRCGDCGEALAGVSCMKEIEMQKTQLFWCIDQGSSSSWICYCLQD